MNTKRPFILCATDFSDRASAAATVAVKFALRRAQTLQFVNVCEPRNVSVVVRARRRLEKEAMRLRELGTAVETLLRAEEHPAASAGNPPARGMTRALGR